MGRSQSASSLRMAGSKLTHIPKRASQHGIFLPCNEVAPISLKPGQKSLQRQVYCEEAKPLEETYLQPDMPAASVYSKSISNVLKPDDYRDPTKPIIPGEAPPGGGHWGAGHWKSEYRSNIDSRAVDGATYYRQHGPPYQTLNPPTCVSAGVLSSSFREDYGLYGSDPRDKVRPDAEKMPVFKSSLTMGTAKGTMHIPGYQGFLPANVRNEAVARVEMGTTLRSTDKTNLTETFHTNVVGYQGHEPMHHANTHGGMRTSLMTTTGRDFQPPNLQAFS
eukprot:CAMPEP_0171106206 /NCGR_PEP_ID=MMETSP0766_2-20121228/64268_1 /TAXON_ID=439317 /ORGANISM="Gambierdiscus australes, Strain CAWD 149" /LENGTH=276 /DNA_ID=CAMNT_0011567249 /DNA_START=96 /DNA_END=926 /DNA_ORIENTATION=-